MIERLILVAYLVGLILGGLSFIEWMVTRVVRVWLAFFVAGILSCALSFVGSAALEIRRRFK